MSQRRLRVNATQVTTPERLISFMFQRRVQRGTTFEEMASLGNISRSAASMFFKMGAEKDHSLRPVLAILVALRVQVELKNEFGEEMIVVTPEEVREFLRHTRQDRYTWAEVEKREPRFKRNSYQGWENSYPTWGAAPRDAYLSTFFYAARAMNVTMTVRPTR